MRTSSRIARSGRFLASCIVLFISLAIKGYFPGAQGARLPFQDRMQWPCQAGLHDGLCRDSGHMRPAAPRVARLDVVNRVDMEVK
jgi:hypothetical protein